MACRLTLLGPPQLLDDQGRLIPIPAKAFALVAYILLTSGGGPVSRASLRQFLWENPDTKTAATNLRKFLLRIRQRQKQFGFELIREERDHVRVAQSVDIDLARFQQISAIQNPGDLVGLCDVYRGDLLEGLTWEEPGAREWLEVQRTKLRDAFVSVVSTWMEAASSRTDKMSLRIAARRLIEVEPYNETGHRALMRLFAEDGEPARVRDLYHSLEQRLRGDLGVEPDVATKELVQALLPARKAGAAAPEKVGGRPAVPPEELDTDASPPIELLENSGTPRVTVLPPLPIVGQDYSHQLAVSLIEDVTIGLCRSKSLSVVAPHTAREMSQNRQKALLRIFKIDYVVETQLKNRGGDPGFSVKLVNAATREIIWTAQYALSPAQTAEHYRDLSIKIILALVDKVERTELVRYDNVQEPTAYHLFLLGQRQMRVLDLPSIRRARRAFKAALSACSDFVPAISGLARSYQVEWLLLARGDSELLGEAARLAKRALEIDPDDARGHRELGICHAYAGRFDESLTALAAGEQRNPQHADLLNDFAEALVHACEPALALEKIGQAIELNPLCPDQYWWAAAGANYQLERYAEAVSCMGHMQDQTPALRLLAASWGMLGNRERAADYALLTRETHPDFRIDSYLSIVPFRDPRIIQRYKEGLRAAGFHDT